MGNKLDNNLKAKAQILRMFLVECVGRKTSSKLRKLFLLSLFVCVCSFVAVYIFDIQKCVGQSLVINVAENCNFIIIQFNYLLKGKIVTELNK